MADEFDLEDHRPRPPVRRPLLGRMSVFVIGVLVGAILGVCGGVAGWTVLGPALGPVLGLPAAAPAGPAPRPAAKVAAKPAAAPAPEPSQALNIAPGRPVVVGVLGDSMGDGLWQGLYRRLHDGGAYQLVRLSQASTGLARYNYVDVQQKTAGQLADTRIDVAVVLFGANDEQGIADGGAVYPFESDGWRRVYAARIDALVTLLRQHGAAVYWVGLPKMKRAEYDRKAGVLNAIYAERARALGVPFVDTVPVTVDRDGAYDDYLAVDGAAHPRLMRAKDGIHMTSAGYQRLAEPVAALLQADVDRTLAGAKAVSTPPVTLVAGPPAWPARAR